ncbi:uroporphyrinogen decarboxylase [Ornithinimicrobium cerasi]|uniref:Uroporphyrinogen decarboxylase n=1 Tax=Ornithinimicrobium cerasi TaxID=2248773 RepID=A0A285VB82_9MICO|nr:uroporphyrinogen decarboxylase [Ornithinimicrobium cerasi]SOC51263.1 uroporphyrinogen decarboxylase [Ornithinimicrobium cerasi]
MTSPVDSPLVRAARRQDVPHTPVWFMRQAGRSLPEYRAIRQDVGMLESCRTPELVTEITLQPVRRHGVDAAILFSDIVVPLMAVGLDLDIVAGVGPVVAEPVRARSDLDRLPELAPEAVPDIAESVRLLVAELGATPLIGFAGAPFTLASYLVEGGPSKNHERTKALMHGDPQLWDDLCARLAQISLAFLRVQADHGASAVQLFDSWAGHLSRADYLRHVEPHSRAVLAGMAQSHPEVPRIHFGVGTGELLAPMADAGADVIGVDYRVSLADAVERTGGRYAVQGNLDPALLFAPWQPLERRVREIVEEGRAAPGHIFNLGHGVLPTTDPDVLTRVVELVHEVSVR